MIQINADHTGGRILARYESPAHSFLFPNGHSPAAANVVEVAMTRSRRYKVHVLQWSEENVHVHVQFAITCVHVLMEAVEGVFSH